jgi:hypothetical protein
MITPESVRQELFMVGKELSKAADAIMKLEIESERAELENQLRHDKTYLTAEGSIEDRKATARSQNLEFADASVVAKANWNRAKLKTKHLELEQMRLMAVLKSIQHEGA